MSMINNELLNYIKQQLDQGVLKQDIFDTLSSQGWQQNDLDQAFSQAVVQNTLIKESENNLNERRTKKNNSLLYTKLTLISVVLLLLAMGGIYAFNTRSKVKPLPNQPIQSLPTESAATDMAIDRVPTQNTKITEPQEAWLTMEVKLNQIQSFDDLEQVMLEYGSKSQVQKIEATRAEVAALPAEFKNQMALIAKTPPGVVITNTQETRTGDTVTLTLTTNKPELKRVVVLVLEDQIWKLKDVTWESVSN